MSIPGIGGKNGYASLIMCDDDSLLIIPINIKAINKFNDMGIGTEFYVSRISEQPNGKVFVKLERVVYPEEDEEVK